MANRNRILLLLLLFGLTACGAGTTTKPAPVEDPTIEVTAKSLMEQGQYDQAATEYLRLATNYPENTMAYRLKAATAFFEANDLINAKLILSETEIDPSNSPVQNLQKNIILARIAISERQAEQALDLLQGLPNEQTPISLQVAFYETRSKAYQNLGLIDNSIEERLIAYSISDVNSEPNIDNQQLWNDLNSLPIENLQSLKQTVDAKSQSWIDLTIIAKTNKNNRQNLESEIDIWRGYYPNHIADNQIIPNILSSSPQNFTTAEQIALLLPLSGKFQKASEAIRDGFISSWLNISSEKPEIKVYDTSSKDIRQVYQTALSEGANVVVGPLQKENVTILAQSPELVTTTTLLLNYVEQDDISQTNPLLYQFGLSPEQEAKQIAEQAQLQGYKTALIITPNSNWGRRLSQSFQSKFEELGGTVLENSNYDPNEKDYDSAVKSLLNTDISRQRAIKLRDTLRLNIESETRSRQDADMIFLGAIHPHAKLILPHIYFQRAKNIPIYATSNIHIFTSDPEDYVDMKKILFTDIPWLLGSEDSYAPSKAIFERHWRSASTTTHRLFALGYDSYMIINQFKELMLNPDYYLNGATGTLKLKTDKTIDRKLKWATIKDGIPTVLSGILYQ